MEIDTKFIIDFISQYFDIVESKDKVEIIFTGWRHLVCKFIADNSVYKVVAINYGYILSPEIVYYVCKEEEVPLETIHFGYKFTEIKGLEKVLKNKIYWKLPLKKRLQNLFT